jgi:hypothetical protein
MYEIDISKTLSVKRSQAVAFEIVVSDNKECVSLRSGNHDVSNISSKKPLLQDSGEFSSASQTDSLNSPSKNNHTLEELNPSVEVIL